MGKLRPLTSKLSNICLLLEVTGHGQRETQFYCTIGALMYNYCTLCMYSILVLVLVQLCTYSCALLCAVQQEHFKRYLGPKKALLCKVCVRENV